MISGRIQWMAAAVIAVLALGSWWAFGRANEPDVAARPVRNDDLGYALERVHAELEVATLAIERALLGDAAALRMCLAQSIDIAIPAPPGNATSDDHLEFTELDPARTTTRYTSQDAVTAAWSHYRDACSVLTDVRFKLKEFTDATTDRIVGRFGLEIRGTLPDATTFQDHAVCRAVFAKPAARWLLTELAVVSRDLTIGRARLFTEVTRAGGLFDVLDEQLSVPGPFLVTRAENVTNLDYGGIACADVDGDQRLDLFVARAQSTDRLYLNVGGGRFEERAQAAGLRSAGGSRAGVFADVDGDGDQDLFVTKASSHHRSLRNRTNRLYLNDGTGQFADATATSGLDLDDESFSATFFDYDLDGDLDLYVCCYGHLGRRPVSNYFASIEGRPNHLYRNLGGGRFEDVTDTAGVGGRAWSYAVAVCDYDDDGAFDIYVANDYGANALYRNRGDGTFEQTQDSCGVADPGNGMGAVWTDIDHDGRFDLYTTNMHSGTGRRILGAAPIRDAERRALLLKFTAGNSMFVAGDDGRFTSRARELGIAACGWAWHADFFDVDRDSDDDLYVANGYITGTTDRDY